MAVFNKFIGMLDLSGFIKAVRDEPWFVLSGAMLVLIVAFFAEIQGLHNPYVVGSISKREIFFLELGFVVVALLNQKSKFPDLKQTSPHVFGLIVIWLLWGFFSALNGLSPNLSLLTYAEHVVLILFAASVYSLIQTYQGLSKTLILIVLVGFVLYCLYLLFFYFIDMSDVAKYDYTWSLKEVGFSNVRHLGYYLAVILVLATSLGVGLLLQRSWHAVIAGAILAVMAWALVFWAGGRGPIVAFLVSTLLMVLVVNGMPSKRKLSGFILLTSSLGIIASLYIPGGYGLEFMFSRSSVGGEGDVVEILNKFSTNRLAIWIACADDIISHPWFGIGQNGYIHGCGSAFKPTSQPHGFVIQAPLEWGIPGAAMFFMIIAVSIRKVWQGFPSTGATTSASLIGFWVVITLLIFSVYDGIFFQRFSLMYFALFLALSLHAEPSVNIGKGTAISERGIYMALLMVVVGILLYLAFNDYPLMPEYTKI